MRAELVVTFADGTEIRDYLEGTPEHIDRTYQAWCKAEHYAGRTIADVELLYGWNALDVFALILFAVVVVGLIVAAT
jgi:hypothetical protein